MIHDDLQPYQIDALELGPMENFVYLITDMASGRAAVVDPAWEAGEIINLAQKKGVRITDILLTHSHHDHINGIDDILAEYDAELHLLRAEAEFWGQHTDLPTLHHGGDEIRLGNTAIHILHTPGHTPGSACYHIDNNLLTGDTMFVFGCGRCDLRGGNPEVMFDTLRHIKETLPQDTLIHPGHNYATQMTSTLAEEIAGNPFLHFEEKQKFVHYRMHEHDKCRHSPYHPVYK